MSEAAAPDPVRGAPVTLPWGRRDGPRDHVPGGPAPLAAWRELDWRFALPAVELGTVAFVGAPPPAEAEALHALGATVTTVDPDRETARHGDGVQADVVVVVAPSSGALDVAAATVRPGGWVLVRTSTSLRPRHRGISVETAPGWQRRLRASGLVDVATWWHAPSRGTCSYIVSTADRDGLRFVLRRWQGTRLGLPKSLVARALVALGLFPYAARDVTVAGRVPGAAAGNGAGAGSVVLVTPWFEASRHVIAVCFRGGRPACVAKVPRRPGDDAGIRREADSLGRLAAASPAAADRGPRVLARPGDGPDVLVEAPLRGKALGPERVRANPARALRLGMELVDVMPVTGSSRADPAWYQRLLATPLERFRRDAPDEVGADALVARTHDRLRALREASDLPLVFEHGDLGHPNLVLRPSGSLAALDWERSDAHGLPAHDAVFLLTYLAEARRGAVAIADRLRAFDDAFLGARPWGRHAVAAHLDRRGVDRALLPPLVLACWARSACGLLERLGGASDGGSLGEGDAALVADDRDVALWRHVDRTYGRLR